MKRTYKPGWDRNRFYKMNEADDKFTNFSVSTINDMTEGSITLTLVFSVITALTAIGNLLVVFAVLLVHKLRYPSNFLIVSLAASDLLVSIMVMPFSSYAEYKQRWDLGEVVCDMYILFDVLLCTASILNLCAISIDRYLAVTRPLEYVTKRTPKRMVIMIATAWISSALISIPPIFGFKDKFVPGACEYSKNFIYQIYACFGAFYLPLIVMLILYGRIVVLARRIVKSDRERLASCSASDDKRSSIQNYAESQETEDDSLLKKPHRFSSFITSLYCLTKGHRESMDSTEKSPESLYPVVTSLPTTVPASAPPQFNNPVVSITEANHSPERSPYPDPGHHFSRLPPHLTRHLTEDSHFNGHPLTSTRRASSNIYTKQQRKSLYPGNVHARIQLPPRIRASSFALGNLPTGSKNTLQGNMKQRFSAHVKKPRIRRSNETKAIRTLGVIMGVFCICWLPFFIVAVS